MKHLLILTWTVVATLVPAADSKPPNVLILYADDLGYGDLAIQNPKSKIPTPNLDGLAREGMRFTDGHSSSGICTPSRYAILTGRYHWRKFHGIVGNFDESVISADRLTLPEMLRNQAYATACIGKWHLGWDWSAIRTRPPEPSKTRRKGRGKPVYRNAPEDFDWAKAIPGGPLSHGFDTYFGDDVINFPPYAWIENDKVTAVPSLVRDQKKWKKIKEGQWESRSGPMVPGWNPYDNLPTTTEKAVQYLLGRKDSSKPFFLYFAFPSPHAPIIPNDAFDGKSQAGSYGDYVTQTDAVCGQLLAALEASGKSDNTIVVFTADNGAEHYAYARDEKHDHWSSAPFRGVKRDLYEGGHHVPFIVKWPGVVEPGSVTDALVSQIDLMGTLADRLEVSLPPSAAEDSLSLMPIFTGMQSQVRNSLVHNTKADRYAVRHGEWILIDAETGYVSKRNADWEAKHGYVGSSDKVELYHYAKDPGQRNNLAGKHPEKVSQLRKILAQIREPRSTN